MISSYFLVLRHYGFV